MAWKQILSGGLLAALSPNVAYAADPKGLECIKTELGPVIFHAIAERKAADWDMPINDAMGEEANDFLDAKDRCAARYGWSESVWRWASVYVKAQMVHDAAELAIRQRGFDPDAFAAEFGRFTPAQRRVLNIEVGVAIDDGALDTILRVTSAKGVHLPHSDRLYIYVGGLLMGNATTEFLPEKFATL